MSDEVIFMVAGVDIGGTKTAVILGEGQTILRREAFPTGDWASTVERITAILRDFPPFEAVGVSCGGPLDSRRGVILSPPNLPGWDQVEIVRLLGERFGVPVALQNDANACAVAEWRYGAGRGCRNMVFLTCGTGFGAGLILDGRLYAGENDMAGEVGHIRLTDQGPVGYGKAGSLEGYCSGGGIAALGRIRATERLQMGKTVSYCQNWAALGEISAKSIAVCADAGAEDAREIYRECGRMLGRGLAVIIDILNPQRIVIGSIYQRSGHLMAEAMRQVLEAEALELSRAVCEVVPAELADAIGDWAALAVAYECLGQGA